MFKIVLDTNVVLGAYLTTGAAAKIVDSWAEGNFELLISEEIIEEYLRILLAKKINPFLVSALNDQFNRYARLILPKSKLFVVNKDPDDNKFIECAFEGNADYIVSNDKHLPGVGKYKNTRILSAQDFLKIIEGSGGRDHA